MEVFDMLIEYEDSKVRERIESVTNVQQLLSFILSRVPSPNKANLRVMYFDPLFNEYVDLDTLQFLPRVLKIQVSKREQNAHNQIQIPNGRVVMDGKSLSYTNATISNTIITFHTDKNYTHAMMDLWMLDTRFFGYTTSRNSAILFIPNNAFDMSSVANVKHITENDLANMNLTIPLDTLLVPKPTQSKPNVIPEVIALDSDEEPDIVQPVTPKSSPVKRPLPLSPQSSPKRQRVATMRYLLFSESQTPRCVFVSEQLRSMDLKQVILANNVWFLNHDGEVFKQSDDPNVITRVESLANIDYMAIGQTHMLFLTKDHKVYGFGNPLYITGSSDLLVIPETQPYLITLLSDHKITFISCGDKFSIFASENLVFGIGEAEQLGINQKGLINKITTLQVPLKSNETIVDVQSSSRHTALLTSIGNIYQWGRVVKFRPIILIHSNVKAISVGKDATMILEKNSLYTMGKNENQRLGISFRNTTELHLVTNISIVPEELFISAQFTIMRSKERLLGFGQFPPFFATQKGEFPADLHWRNPAYFDEQDIGLVSRMVLSNIAVNDTQLLLCLRVTDRDVSSGLIPHQDISNIPNKVVASPPRTFPKSTPKKTPKKSMPTQSPPVVPASFMLDFQVGSPISVVTEFSQVQPATDALQLEFSANDVIDFPFDPSMTVQEVIFNICAIRPEYHENHIQISLNGTVLENSKTLQEQGVLRSVRLVVKDVACSSFMPN